MPKTAINIMHEPKREINTLSLFETSSSVLPLFDLTKATRKIRQIKERPPNIIAIMLNIVFILSPRFIIVKANNVRPYEIILF